MAEFQLDGKHLPEFRALDAFTQGYIVALFFTEHAPGTTTEEWQATEEHAEGSIPDDVGFADLAPEALERIKSDCERFQAEAAGLLLEAYESGGERLAYTQERAGHDFWLTRNGHGAGFWSRDWEHNSDVGDRLTARCKVFSNVDVYLGDDGKVYTL
jgi:hypothetical protein